MRNVFALIAALIVLIGFQGVVLADDPAPASPASLEATTAVSESAERSVPPLKLGPIGMGLSVIGVGVGLGLIGFSALGSIARQPEQAGNIRTVMLIIGGLVEGAGIIALVLCFVAN